MQKNHTSRFPDRYLGASIKCSHCETVLGEWTGDNMHLPVTEVVDGCRIVHHRDRPRVLCSACAFSTTCDQCRSYMGHHGHLCPDCERLEHKSPSPKRRRRDGDEDGPPDRCKDHDFHQPPPPPPCPPAGSYGGHGGAVFAE